VDPLVRDSMILDDPTDQPAAALSVQKGRGIRNPSLLQFPDE
jgi:hypothetical protein